MAGTQLTKDQAIAAVRSQPCLQAHELVANDNGDKECPVCRDEYEHEEAIKYCHIMGRSCLLAWMQEDNNSCPICRSKLFCKADGDDDEADQAAQLDQMVDVEMADAAADDAAYQPTRDEMKLEIMRSLAIEAHHGNSSALAALEREAANRASLWSAGSLPTSLATYAAHEQAYERQNYDLFFGVPTGRYNFDAIAAVDQLRSKYWQTLAASLSGTTLLNPLSAAAHPVALLAMESICIALQKHVEWQRRSGMLASDSAVAIERRIHAEIARQFPRLRQESVPGGRYPPRMLAFVADMMDDVLVAVVGEEGLRDYAEKRRADSRVPW